MLNVTNGSAKELLPLGESTVIEWVLGEAFNVCDQAVVVWDINKGDLPIGVAWVPQMPLRGLAPAIASGVTTEATNLILLPDAIFLPHDPAGKMAVMGEGDVVLALSQVTEEEVSKYGICEVDEHGFVTRMLEKPSPSDTTSRWAITGRYRLSGKAAELLIETTTANIAFDTEMDMSHFFSAALENGLRIAGCFLDESFHRFDCGDPEGYRLASEAFAK